MDPITTQSPQQPSQQQPPTSPITTTPEHKNTGLVVAIVVIILVLIVGALYIFASRMSDQNPNDTTTTALQENTADTQSTEIQPVSNKADDVKSLEADLNTSIDGLDSQNF